MKPFFPQARRQNGDSEVQALHAAPAHALPALRRRAHPRKRPCARGRLHRRRYGPLGSRVRLPRRRRFDPRPVDDAEGRPVLLCQRHILEPQDRGRHPREREPHVAHRHAPARPQHGEPLPLRAHPPRVRGRILRGHSRARRGRLRHARYLLPGRTKIEANANKFTFVWKKSTDKYQEALRRKVRAHLEAIDALDDEEDALAPPTPPRSTPTRSAAPRTGSTRGSRPSERRAKAKTPRPRS